MTFSRIALVLLLVVSWPTQAKLFVPDLEPWEYWVPANEDSTATIDHTAWQRMLDRHLVTDASDGVYRFSYAAVNQADRVELQAYLDRMSRIDPRQYARPAQQAYWINLYNALTVELVLEHYPVASIRKIYGGLLGTGPWDEPVIEVAGQSLTLNDIEHRILRPIWRDPRIHYAVNCASLGCPNLAPQAYTAANVDELLDAGARSFINHPRGVALLNGQLRLSSIYDWYDTDFGGPGQGLLQHLLTYAEPDLREKLADYVGKIRFDYDWRLNEA